MWGEFTQHTIALCVEATMLSARILQQTIKSARCGVRRSN